MVNTFDTIADREALKGTRSEPQSFKLHELGSGERPGRPCHVGALVAHPADNQQRAARGNKAGCGRKSCCSRLAAQRLQRVGFMYEIEFAKPLTGRSSRLATR